MTNPQTWFCQDIVLINHLLGIAEWFIFYLCSCLLTQLLYKATAKATFNVKENINDIIKNSITLTINITTLPTKIRKNWWQNHIC